MLLACCVLCWLPKFAVARTVRLVLLLNNVRAPHTIRVDFIFYVEGSDNLMRAFEVKWYPHR